MLILAGIGGCAAAGWKLWIDARDEAQHEAHNLSVVLAEQTARSMQAAGLVLREIQSDLNDIHVTSPENYRRKVESRVFIDAMAGRLRDLPQVAALSALDDHGDLVSSTRRLTGAPLALGNRDYFEYCRQNPRAAPYISSTVQSRVDGTPVFFLVQCIASEQGDLLGSVMAVVSINYFMDFYAGIGLPKGSDVAIIRSDGTTLISYPAQGAPLLPALIGPGERESNLVIPGVDGGGSRYVSVNRLTSYPLAVSVGISERYALAHWREQVQWVAVGCLCAITSTLVLLSRLVAAIRRSVQSQAELVDRNDALLSVQGRLEAQASSLTQVADALRESEARLAEQTRVLETTLEHMDQGLIMVTAERRVAVFNGRACKMLNLPPELMRTLPAFSDVLAYQWQTEEFSYTPADLQAFVRAGGILDQEHTYQRKRPNGRFIEVCSIPLEGGGMVRTYSDITERKQGEERLTFLAYHDALTGLPNRHVLQDRLRVATESAHDVPGLAVLYLDLDRFKLVNDTRGHAIGDELLVQVARRIQDCLREGDFVARLGGDEFAAVMPVQPGGETALLLAGRLQAAISAPYELDGQLSRVGVSIGIALYPKDGITAEALLRGADSALYRAKASGRNAVCCHESEAEQEDRGRLILEQELRLAVEAEQFELSYQPIFDVQTGVPTGVEALLRWRHPTRGVLLPGQFISIAEETGVINEIGRWVMQTACIEAATWAMPVRLAVNVSSVQFESANVEQQVAAALQASGLSAERLDLEVTERLLISGADSVGEAIRALHSRGVRLVMDDFGIGHSSLQTLQRFPFRQVKIDRTFVSSINAEEGSGAIVRAIMAMAESLKLDVVAEGVETTEQLASLRELGCRYVQGFLLQPPQTPEWIRDYLWRSTTARSGEMAG